MLKALGSIPSTAEKNSVLLCPGSFPAEVTVAQLCLSSRHPRSKHKCLSVCDESIHTPSHSFFHFYKTWNHMEHGTYTMFAVLLIIAISLWLSAFVTFCLASINGHLAFLARGPSPTCRGHSVP